MSYCLGGGRWGQMAGERVVGMKALKSQASVGGLAFGDSMDSFLHVLGRQTQSTLIGTFGGRKMQVLLSLLLLATEGEEEQGAVSEI